MRKAIFPGTFDPPTNGHLNLIQRAAGIFDEVEVVIAVNKRKKCLFEDQERLEMMKRLLTNLPNVGVNLCDQLIVDYAVANRASVIIRGVRALTDFSYEFELAMTNKGLNPEIETMFLPTDPQFFTLRSSAIKEIAMFGGDISAMVPESVAAALKSRLDELDYT